MRGPCPCMRTSKQAEAYQAQLCLLIRQQLHLWTGQPAVLRLQRLVCFQHCISAEIDGTAWRFGLLCFLHELPNSCLRKTCRMLGPFSTELWMQQTQHTICQQLFDDAQHIACPVISLATDACLHIAQQVNQTELMH